MVGYGTALTVPLSLRFPAARCLIGADAMQDNREEKRSKGLLCIATLREDMASVDFKIVHSQVQDFVSGAHAWVYHPSRKKGGLQNQSSLV